jgi:hypothetical protein
MSCPFCEKGGIPIMPTRLALALSENPVKEAGTPFSNNPPKETKVMKYVLRSLRAGYLYVYDEAQVRWDAYIVTENGYYYKHDINVFTPPVASPKPSLFPAGSALSFIDSAPNTSFSAPAVNSVNFSCSRFPADVALASCITIPNTKKTPAKSIWLAFSDVEWTKDVINKHNVAAYRDSHMRKVDVAAWVAGKVHAYCDKLETADTFVAEYALNKAIGEPEFIWSPFKFESKKTASPYFTALAEAAALKTAEAKKQKRTIPALQVQNGLVVRLPDPSSLARETSRLIQHKTNEFLTDKSRVRELALSNSILAMKEAIATQSVQKEIDGAEYLANQMTTDNPIGMMSKSYRDSVEKMRTVTPAMLARAKEQSWNKYKLKYSEDKRAAFEKKYNDELIAFDTQWVAPLAKLHDAWMQHDSMLNYFEFNFDTKDIMGGFVYQSVFALCVENMADKTLFAERCQKWFNGEVVDKRNPLLRSLVLNNDVLAKKIQDTASSPFDWRSPGWENLFGTLKAAFEAAEKAGHSGAYAQWLQGAGFSQATARLMFEISGPMIRFLSKVLAPNIAAPSLRARAPLLALGLINNSPIVAVTVTGSKKEFRAMLVRRILSSSGQNFSGRALEKAVADEMRRLQVQGVALEGSVTKTWLLAVDEDAMRNITRTMPNGGRGMTESARAQALMQAIHTPAQLDAVTSNFKKVLNMSVRLGIANLICQGFSLSKAMDDEASAMGHEKTENHTKLYGTYGAVFGTMAEITGSAVSNLPALTLRAAQGVKWAKIFVKSAEILGYVGRGLGAVAGCITAFFDFQHGREEFKQGSMGMASLYFVSAGLGAIIAVCLAMGWLTGGLAWLLLGIFVALTVLIELVKDNKLESWLTRTLWGKLGDEYGVKGDPYKSLEKEQEELKLATAG